MATMDNPRVYTLESEILGRRRKLAVWVPPEYEKENRKKFPVIYQQDGQLALSSRDDELPFGSWRLDSEIERLSEAGEIRPAIVVAVYSSSRRLKEYYPFTEEFERYERFMIQQLIPWVEERYRVLDGPENRFLMGSSMGGLVSFALALRNPAFFGGAGALSPWFEYDNNRYVHDVLRPLREKPELRLYIDSGIRDWRNLDDGHRGVLLARLELLRLGFVEGGDLDWMVDCMFPDDDVLAQSPVKEEKREDAKWNQHNDFQWGRRVGRPLRFLLAD